MALHSVCTCGGPGTGDSGCHSLKDKCQINESPCSFPSGLWALTAKVMEQWDPKQATLVSKSKGVPLLVALVATLSGDVGPASLPL